MEDLRCFSAHGGYEKLSPLHLLRIRGISQGMLENKAAESSSMASIILYYFQIRTLRCHFFLTLEVMIFILISYGNPLPRHGSGRSYGRVIGLSQLLLSDVG